jgi:hypothetical protein
LRNRKPFSFQAVPLTHLVRNPNPLRLRDLTVWIAVHWGDQVEAFAPRAVKQKWAIDAVSVS